MHDNLNAKNADQSVAVMPVAPAPLAGPLTATASLDPGVDGGEQATRIRYRVIGVSVLMAFILYLDRVCLGEIVKSESFQSDFDAPKERIGNVLGAFVFTYALMQIPAGWASDRFGACGVTWARKPHVAQGRPAPEHRGRAGRRRRHS